MLVRPLQVSYIVQLRCGWDVASFTIICAFFIWQLVRIIWFDETYECVQYTLCDLVWWYIVMLGTILLDGMPSASGLSAPCARRNPVPVACFFFAASDLGGATLCQFDVRNMMVWTRELRWNRAIVGICVKCLGCNSRTGLFWDLLPCYFWQSDQANAGPWNLVAKRKHKDIYSSTISIIMADGSSPISIGCQL